MIYIKRKKIILTTTIILIITLITSGLIYLNDYYKADDVAIKHYTSNINTESFTTKILSDDTIVYQPENATIGFIFYPGGKVDYTAYTPLMQACAEKNILCVLLKMPFNLAVFDINGADGIQKQFSQIKSWYIGGHSLGGSMASSYLNKNSDEYDGLILLASYSTSDLTDDNLKVLSIYGSEDKVLNKEKYEENKNNISKNLTEIVIDGGCHAYFGMYGEQEGDGIATITSDYQINTTADAIINFVS